MCVHTSSGNRERFLFDAGERLRSAAGLGEDHRDIVGEHRRVVVIDVGERVADRNCPIDEPGGGERHRQLDQPHVAEHVRDHQLRERFRSVREPVCELERQLGVGAQLLLGPRSAAIAVRGFPEVRQQPER